MVPSILLVQTLVVPCPPCLLRKLLVVLPTPLPPWLGPRSTRQHYWSTTRTLLEHYWNTLDGLQNNYKWYYWLYYQLDYCLRHRNYGLRPVAFSTGSTGHFLQAAGNSYGV